MKKVLRITFIILGLYLLLCILVFSFQEKLIFIPEKLSADHQFDYKGNITELNIKTNDNHQINGLLFKTKNPKGLVFYLHGNAGSLKNWGNVGETYNYFGYDTFILDYRGYGKSGGNIENEEQIFSDVQLTYNQMKKAYNEKDIIVLGYSIGTGPAAKLSSENNPKMLILQAPYFSLVDMMKHRFPIFPTILLKYKFRTDQYLPKCSMPIVIFHGTNDNVIPYSSSLKLKDLLKPSDTLITLHGEGHNGMTDSYEYLAAIQKILDK